MPPVTRHYCPKRKQGFFRWFSLSEGAFHRVYYPSGNADLREHARKTAELAAAGCGAVELEDEIHEGCRSALCRHYAEPAPPQSPVDK